MSQIRTVALAAVLMASAAAVGAAGPDGPTAATIDIVMTNFDFAPKTIALERDRPYRLHFVNRGSGGHNFAAPEFFAAARIDPAGAGAIKKGSVELRKGGTVDVRLIPAAGTYPVKCTHFMHSTFGMVGSIVVQ